MELLRDHVILYGVASGGETLEELRKDIGDYPLRPHGGCLFITNRDDVAHNIIFAEYLNGAWVVSRTITVSPRGKEKALLESNAQYIGFALAEQAPLGVELELYRQMPAVRDNVLA